MLMIYMFLVEQIIFPKGVIFYHASNPKFTQNVLRNKKIKIFKLFKFLTRFKYKNISNKKKAMKLKYLFE